MGKAEDVTVSLATLVGDADTAMCEDDDEPETDNETPRPNHDPEGDVNAADDGGYFARWGTPAPQNLGADAGTHLS